MQETTQQGVTNCLAETAMACPAVMERVKSLASRGEHGGVGCVRQASSTTADRVVSSSRVRRQRTSCVAMVCFALVACATRSSLAERSIEQAPSDVLRIPASRFDDPTLKSQVVDLRSGIGPDEAATIAVYANPALRAIRNRRGLAAAQLIQAGILPNPVVSYARDFVTGGNTAGTVTAYNFTAAWELSALVPFLPKQTAARKNFGSVDLDVAWQEWQIAVNARTAVYRVLGLNAQTAQAREATEGLQQSTDAVRKATEAHEKTVLDLAAVEASSQDSRATMLALEQDFEHQRLGLNKILGVEPETKVRLRAGLMLPTHL